MSNRNDEARATFYRLLGIAFLYPAELDWELFTNSFQSLIPEAANELGLNISAELKTLSTIWPIQYDESFLHAHTELFINSPNGIIAPLNESVYFGLDQQVNTERTAEVEQSYLQAGFRRCEEHKHLLADHLSLELEFMALCLLKGDDLKAFFNHHIYSWQPKLIEKISTSNRSPFYTHMSMILYRFLETENRIFKLS